MQSFQWLTCFFKLYWLFLTFTFWKLFPLINFVFSRNLTGINEKGNMKCHGLINNCGKIKSSRRDRTGRTAKLHFHTRSITKQSSKVSLAKCIKCQLEQKKPLQQQQLFKIAAKDRDIMLLYHNQAKAGFKMQKLISESVIPFCLTMKWRYLFLNKVLDSNSWNESFQDF